MIARAIFVGIAAVACSAHAEETAFVFNCKLSEKVRIFDLAGKYEDSNEPERSVLIKASDGSFQIYLDKQKKWSENFCLPEDPADEASTHCVMSADLIEATWPVSRTDRIHNAQNSWAMIGMDGTMGYRLKVLEDGSVSLLYKSSLAHNSVRYYMLRPDGSEQGHVRNPRVDNWAGYDIESRGQGACNRIQ